MKKQMDGWQIMKLMGVIWILVLLVLFLGWEDRTRGYVWKTVNEESEVMLREMPSLKITEAEYAVENKLNLTTSLCYYQSEEEPTTKIINVSNSKDDISKSLLYINYENNVFEKQKQERIWFDQTRRILKNIFS